MVNLDKNFKKTNLLCLLDDYNGGILIPKIQRDYAQGRAKISDEGRAENVRKDFLNDIFGGKVKNLDFVFGTKTKKEGREYYIPIDGQQRLTTLFLLYLYREKVLVPNDSLSDKLVKFSYDTRRAARDFCKEIVQENWNIIRREGEHSDDISSSIKNNNWFMDYWQYDPTVDSMLRMLDAIDVKQKEKKDYSHPDVDNITFYCFDMDAYNINENLYLKMNSRGKPLTPFENLKASIDDLLTQKGEDGLLLNPKVLCFNSLEKHDTSSVSGNNFLEKWEYYIDRDWTNWFWNNGKSRNDTIDKAFAEFICRFLGGYQRIMGEDSISNGEIQNKLCIEVDDRKIIPFDNIRDVFVNCENAFESMALILMLFGKGKFEDIKPSWKIEDNKIKIETYPWLAVIQAYILSSDDKHEMECWVRFAWNMAENYVTGAENYLTFCQILRYLKEKRLPLYETLEKYEIEILNNWNNEQLKEEIEKVKQIIVKGENPNAIGPDEQKIIESEKYAFFHGAIRFLFTNENGEIGTGKNNNNEDFNSWNDYDKKWKNSQKYFDENGIKRIYNKDGVLLRAFLSQIDDRNCLYEIYYNHDKDNWKRNILLNKENYMSKAVSRFLLLDLDDDADYSMFTSPLMGESKIVHEQFVRSLKKLDKNKELICDYRLGLTGTGHPRADDDIYGVRRKLLSLLSPLSGYNWPNVGQSVRFEYKGYIFYWHNYNWVDMYDKDENNLWAKGDEIEKKGNTELGEAYKRLHSHYPDESGNESDKELFFNEYDFKHSLTDELDRCIKEYNEIKSSE